MAGVNIPVRNGQLVDHVGSAIHHGTESLDVIPKLLRQLLDTEAWREFKTKLGEDVTHERFTDFVNTPPLKGLGTDVRTLENICHDDADALRELRKATVGKAGAHSPASNRSRKASHGTTKAYALVRLERERPDLHELVLAGKVSVHAASIAAGFVPRTATVPIDDPDRLAATLRRRLTPAALDRLRELLG
jgi:hypothetical protein